MSLIEENLKALDISKLAIPSNIRYGTAMFNRGGVQLTFMGDERVEAVVGGLGGNSIEGGGGKRKVHFWLEDTKLKTHCNGNPKNHDIFCKHCVALWLQIIA
jgi:hypothetical protein